MSASQPPTMPGLLAGLLNTPLDPGYAAAARRRAEAGEGSPPWFRALAVLISGMLGAVLAIGWNQTHQAAPARDVLHAQLVQRVRAAEQDTQRLANQVQSIGSSVASLQSAALAGNATGQRIRAQLQQAQIVAGTVAVTGPGLQVVLGNPPRPSHTATAGGRAGSTPIGSVALITDRDVRSVVNALWAAGAQAVAVNQARVTPLTAIRFAGEEILVDYQSVSSPYTINAIGNPDQLSLAFAQSPEASRYTTQASALGVLFSFRTQRSLLLPAGVIADLNYASAVPMPPVPQLTASPSTPAPTTSRSPR